MEALGFRREGPHAGLIRIVLAGFGGLATAQLRKYMFQNSFLVRGVAKSCDVLSHISQNPIPQMCRHHQATNEQLELVDELVNPTFNLTRTAGLHSIEIAPHPQIQ